MLLSILGIRVAGDILYQFPSNESIQIPRDATIICLGGGKGRIEAAFTLFASGIGKDLYIVGVGKKSTVPLLLKNHAPDLQISGERLSRVQVETESKNTMENAVAVSAYLNQHPDVKTIVLVTSGYHMRRATFIIGREAHKSLEIIPFNPPNEFIEQENWWHSWVGIQVTVVEYLKYFIATEIYPLLSNI